ncbi:MAG: efflux transporter outer membrane subunit [Thermodesulfobacteriota bacterium]
MINFNKAIVMVMILGLSGCSVHHGNIPELPGPLPENFIGAEADQDFSEPGRFWERFNDPKLNELVGIGLDGNLSAKKAIARYNQFSALERISKSSYLPFLNLNSSAGTDQQQSTLGSFDGSSLRLSAVAGYEIDLWNKLGSGRSTATYNRQASVADIKTAFITVAAQVADLYYFTVEQRAQLELNEQIIASQADTLARMESRYEAGLVPALDVYQARQNIIGAKANKPTFQANLAKGSHALATILGQFPSQNLSGELTELPAILPEVPVGLPSELISRRPDIEAALLRLRARDQEVAAAVAARFPSFNLNATVGNVSLDYASKISGTVWSLVLDTVLPIFDYGRRRAEVERRRAILEEELARYHQTVLAAFQEVEDALIVGRTGEEQIKLLEERYEATSATLRLAEDQYFAGLTDYLSVLTAQKNHFELQAQLLTARRRLISERISLMKALGGDWMVADINNRLQENGEKK